MRYLTSVQDGEKVKHIIEISGKSVEVVQSLELSGYKRFQNDCFCFNDIVVYGDLTFRQLYSNRPIHLAAVVHAIEVVRFILEVIE